MQSVAIKIRGVDDIISFIDSCRGIPDRAGVVWWLPRKARLDEAADAMSRIYARAFVAAPEHCQVSKRM